MSCSIRGKISKFSLSRSAENVEPAICNGHLQGGGGGWGVGQWSKTPRREEGPKLFRIHEYIRASDYSLWLILTVPTFESYLFVN